jgi:hypothetical protein
MPGSRSTSSTIATSTRDCEHDRGEHDRVNRKNEHGRVPDMAQQAEMGGARRNPIMTTQAATIITDIGVT